MISAQEALQLGLIHAIREFQPPKGATLFHIDPRVGAEGRSPAA